jgi:hypothetical protein
MREMDDIKAGIDQRYTQRNNAIDDTNGDAKNYKGQQRVKVESHYVPPAFVFFMTA